MAALTKFDIAGKHAIVTGGAQGLSRGMAEGLLEAGCKVVIIDVQKEKVEKVCEEYRAKGLEAYPVIGNLADRADLNRAFDEALQILDGRLDVLIPAAGIQRRYLPEDMKGPVVFLASAASDYLNGALIPVDGGYLVK